MSPGLRVRMRRAMPGGVQKQELMPVTSTFSPLEVTGGQHIPGMQTH